MNNNDENDSSDNTDNEEDDVDYLVPSDSERSGRRVRDSFIDEDSESSKTSVEFDFLFQAEEAARKKQQQQEEQQLRQAGGGRLSASAGGHRLSAPAGAGRLSASSGSLPPPSVAFHKSPVTPKRKKGMKSHTYSLQPFLKTGVVSPTKTQPKKVPITRAISERILSVSSHGFSSSSRSSTPGSDKKSNDASPAKCICVVTLLLVLLGLAIYLLVHVVSNNKSSSSTPQLKKPAKLPTGSADLSDYFLEKLSQSTVDAINKQHDSPQAHAYRWFQEDLKSNDYSDYRQLLRFTLATFYYATEGAEWRDHERWLEHDSHECAWNPDPIKAATVNLAVAWPITCYTMDKTEECNWKDDDTADCALLYINLPHKGLAGTLPEEIGLLTDLVHLILSDNEIGGSLPTQIGELTDLKTFDIGKNFFTGTLPTEIENLNLLEKLDVSQNHLKGDLPLKNEDYNRIVDLRISGNDFKHEAPEGGGSGSGGNLLDILPQHTKSYIHDHENSPQAQAYAWIMEDEKIHVHPNHRKLRRFILATLYFATQGEEWDAEEKWLDNSQHECGWNPMLITCFQMFADTQCAWEEHEEISCRIAKLHFADLGLHGTIPHELGLLSNELTEFVAPNNQLIRTIPTTIGDLTELRTLNLGNNELSGNLPASIGNLHKLVVLNLHNNKLQGSLPTQIGELNNLFELYLQKNKFDGIPHEMENLSELHTIDLSDNDFGGFMPTIFGKLKNLRSLSAGSCGFAGTIPLEFSEIAPMLNSFSVPNNNLHGSLPNHFFENLQYLDVSHNGFFGPFPSSDEYHYPNIEYMILDYNAFTGPIDDSIGLSTNLEVLSCPGNHLSGTIPTTISELKLLRSLILNDHSTNAPEGSNSTDTTEEEEEEEQTTDNTFEGSVPAEVCQMVESNSMHPFPLQITVNCEDVDCDCDCTCSQSE